MKLFSKMFRALGRSDEASVAEDVTVQAPSPLDRFAVANREAFKLIGALPEEQILAEERRLAIEVTDILVSVKPLIREGVSRLDIQEHVLLQLENRQLLPALVGYKGYPAAVPVSVNHELISVMPSPALLPASALVKVEVVASSHKGYGAQSWTFASAAATPQQLHLLASAREALESGLGQVRGGAPVAAIGAAIQDVLDARGLSAVTEFCGYTMGRQRIQEPQVLGYRAAGPSALMVAGQVLNVQVLAKAGTRDVRVMSDGWRVLARDREDGVVLSAMVQVSEDGAQRLSGFID